MIVIERAVVVRERVERRARLARVGIETNELPEEDPIWRYFRYAASGVATYHGYKRNSGSIGWALGWGLLASLFPVPVLAIALAQGLGHKAKR